MMCDEMTSERKMTLPAKPLRAVLATLSLLVGCDSKGPAPAGAPSITGAATAGASFDGASASAGSNLPSDPLAIPDFLDGPKFSVSDDIEQQAANLRRDVEVELPKIRRHRTEANALNPGDPTNVTVLSKAITRFEFDEAFLKYWLRDLEAYQEHTSDTGEAKAAGERLLRGCAEAVCDAAQRPTVAELVEFGQAALDAGSHDPLVRLYAAIFRFQADDKISEKAKNEELERVLTELVRDLPKTRYPRSAQMLSRVWLATLQGRKEPLSKNPRTPQNSRWPAAVVAIVRWLEEEGDEHPEWRRCRYRRFIEWWRAMRLNEQAMLLSGMMQGRKIDPWLIHTLAGDFFVSRAWQHRGGGYADKVTVLGWEGFEKNLKSAAIHLQYAWHLDPTCPEPASQMITVAKAGGDPDGTPREWFQRATESQYDYYESYANLWDALRPRWGGSVLEMITLGQGCLDTNRFKTFVPEIALDIIEDIEDEELESGQTVANSFGIQSLMKRFVAQREQFRQKNPQETMYSDHPQYRTRLALLLQRAELIDESIAEFRAIGERLDDGVLQKLGRPGKYELSLLFASHGAERARVLALADKLHRSWDRQTTPEQADQIAKELRELKPLATEPNAQRFFQHAERMLEQLREYSAGNWVELKYDSELLGFEPYVRQWEVSPDHETLLLKDRNGMAEQLRIRPLAAFRPPFEIEADIDPGYGVQWCLWSKRPRDHRQPYFGTEMKTVTKLQTNKSIRRLLGEFVLDGWSDSFTAQVRKVSPQKLRIKLWNKMTEVRVGDGLYATRIFATGMDEERLPVTYDDGLNPDGALNFGDFHADRFSYDGRTRTSGELRLGRIRLRRLDLAEPPPETASLDEKRTYWTSRLSVDADDPLALLRVARVELDDRHYEKAAAHALRARELCPLLEGTHAIAGLGLYRTGHGDEAEKHIRLAAKEMEDDPFVTAAYVDLIATIPYKDPQGLRQQLPSAMQAVNELEYREPYSLATVAAIHAQLGDFEQARKWNFDAINVAEPADKPKFQERQEFYKANKPYYRTPSGGAAESNN